MMFRTMFVVVVLGWILAFILALTVLTLREARGAECRVDTLAVAEAEEFAPAPTKSTKE